MSWGADPEGYSRDLELVTEGVYDPTYETHSTGVLAARTCHRCGAIVDAAAVENHDAFHARIGS